MTKKDYERAASMIQDTRRNVNGPRDVEAIHAIEGAFAAFFASDNPRFDRERFLRACVPGANVRARGRVYA